LAAGLLLAPASHVQQKAPVPQPVEQRPADRDDERQQAESDLQAAIAHTRRGEFARAIPLFLAARGRVAQPFALEFNLALCYVGTRQFPAAIRILSQLGGGQRAGDVENLLAQALVGAHQPEAALKALGEAAEIAPKNEKLYVLVSQACLDEGLYDLGLRVLEVGMRNLPDSARLRFERGLMYSQLDEADLANREFQLAQQLAPGSDIAYISAAEQAFASGQLQDVIRTAREGIRAGCTHYLLLTMLGEALLRAGATPTTAPEFREAQDALEKAVAERPGYSSARIGLGRVYLTLGRVDDAVAQLESARRSDPRNHAVYQPLATAYRRAGQSDKAREALAALAELNRQEAARIGSAEGGHAGYSGGRSSEKETSSH
jgi:tetratricopeptide (TPR) repeat protein